MTDRQEYRYLRQDVLERRVKDMRDNHMPVEQIRQKLGRTRLYTELLIEQTERKYGT